MYVIDTSVVSALHKNYYREHFPTLWKNFDGLVASGRVTSTREAFRELEDFGGDSFTWAKEHEHIFAVPDAAEGAQVVRIYAIEHFQANMEKQKLLKGGRNKCRSISDRTRCCYRCDYVDDGAVQAERREDSKYLRPFRHTLC